jgi:hypothetical protein
MKLSLFTSMALIASLFISCAAKKETAAETTKNPSAANMMMNSEMCLPMGGYFEGVKALAQDDFAGALKGFKKMETDMKMATNGEAKENQEAVLKVLKPVTSASDIKAMRTGLVALSKTVIECNDDCGMGTGVYTYHCPMKNADWMSTSSTVENPYYGKSMLDCGSLVVKKEKEKKK